MASIELKRFSLNPLILIKEQHAYPVKVVATGNGMPSDVFVFVKGKDDKVGTDPQKGDSFECVASVPQLSEIPVKGSEVVTETEQVPYYRTNEVTLFARTESEAQVIWDTVQRNIAILVDNFNSKDNLIESESVTIYG